MSGGKMLTMVAAATIVALLTISGCAAPRDSSDNTTEASAASASGAGNSENGEGGMARIAAIYSAPQSQVVTAEDGSKETVDAFVYIYNDGTYCQYVNHGGRLEPYSVGTCELNGELDVNGPINVTFHVNKLHGDDHEFDEVDLSYDVDLSRADDLRLYPVNGNTGKEIVAAFMQVDKQKLMKLDGTEAELTTMWFYYDDATFEQYAISEDGESISFSTGDYSFSKGNVTDEGSVLTLHRTQKYQDGKGLVPYDSLHDYVIGELGFVRIYPEEKV